MEKNPETREEKEKPYGFSSPQGKARKQSRRRPDATCIMRESGSYETR